ncbi:hypothetical protein Sme01_14130 [Sphaerisporangium melleum]|uniref:DUF397 domain-containing protein n=1 Tax=Sphaerisporangium melleum TaxID=321316 RepID=A0A917QUW7_9ACTN|nr:DUF397 domain-containing protein [Sphaerisporangium melleum]GGK68828.1 hypothetical protein GCM10007964_09730 [Sphaerisporangium melleum]GII68937.1 hypothetical protein Sme01_14130 [Sphaerisporangium melleum]
MNALNWRKSSYSSGNGGDCVEVAPLAEGVAVRDSKRPTEPVLRCGTEAWRAFIRGVEAHPTLRR